MIHLTSQAAPIPIAPSEVRYIKLGPSGAWAETCLAQGELRFSDGDLPRELAEQGDFEAVRQHYLAAGRASAKASDLTREIRDFFSLGPDCLWITFTRGALWWVFADPEVHWLGGDAEQGRRARKVLGAWRSTDARGRELTIADLSTRLTKVRSYQQTICGIEDAAYLLRKINAEPEPLVLRAQAARDALTGVALEVIARLHQSDFELLADLILARSGWRRISSVGGGQADSDLVLEDGLSGARAFVQVKSAADQGVLDDYVARYEALGHERMIFVCHSPRGSLSVGGRSDVSLWIGGVLAQRALDAGLFDWLIRRVA